MYARFLEPTASVHACGCYPGLGSRLPAQVRVHGETFRGIGVGSGGSCSEGSRGPSLLRRRGIAARHLRIEHVPCVLLTRAEGLGIAVCSHAATGRTLLLLLWSRRSWRSPLIDVGSTLLGAVAWGLHVGGRLRLFSVYGGCSNGIVLVRFDLEAAWRCRPRRWLAFGCCALLLHGPLERAAECRVDAHGCSGMLAGCDRSSCSTCR